MDIHKESLEALLRVKEIEIIKLKQELWFEKYNRAGEQISRYEKELKEKEVKCAS